MQPASIILCEGVLSAAIPLGLAAWELWHLHRSPPPPSRPAAPPITPAPRPAGQVESPRIRVLEDA